MSTIDNKIDELRDVTSNFLFIEYYSHTQCDMWKIMNEYTHYKSDKLVLCQVDEGIEKALDLAIKEISSRKVAADRGVENAL
jgi:hypothetical protein